MQWRCSFRDDQSRDTTSSLLSYTGLVKECHLELFIRDAWSIADVEELTCEELVDHETPNHESASCLPLPSSETSTLR